MSPKAVRFRCIAKGRTEPAERLAAAGKEAIEISYSGDTLSPPGKEWFGWTSGGNRRERRLQDSKAQQRPLSLARSRAGGTPEGPSLQTDGEMSLVSPSGRASGLAAVATY